MFKTFCTSAATAAARWASAFFFFPVVSVKPSILAELPFSLFLSYRIHEGGGNKTPSASTVIFGLYLRRHTLKSVESREHHTRMQWAPQFFSQPELTAETFLRRYSTPCSPCRHRTTHTNVRGLRAEHNVDVYGADPW